MSDQIFHRPDMSCNVCGKIGVHANGKCARCYNAEYRRIPAEREKQRLRSKKWREEHGSHRDSERQCRDLKWIGSLTGLDRLNIICNAFAMSTDDYWSYISMARARNGDRQNVADDASWIEHQHRPVRGGQRKGQ